MALLQSIYELRFTIYEEKLTCKGVRRSRFHVRSGSYRRVGQLQPMPATFNRILRTQNEMNGVMATSAS